MKVINAMWEEKNLGLTTTEIICEAGDSPEELAKTLACLTTFYNVLKIPAGAISLLQTAASHDFIFMETQVMVYRDLLSFKAEHYLNGPLQQMDYGPMGEEDMQELFQELAKGLFTTDRIALDPFFPSR